MTAPATDPAHLAVDFYRVQALRGRAVANSVQRTWRSADRSDLTGWFEVHYSDFTRPILDAMIASAFAAQQYVAAQAEEQATRRRARRSTRKGSRSIPRPLRRWRTR
ncbi:hypothetical protein GS461_13425 [Rhodococcus hoagii]|nr:hypothetical protein [Prescottella equi]